MILDKRCAVRAVVASLFCCALAGCSGHAAHPSSVNAQPKPQVVVSMSTLAALVQAVGDSRISIRTLVPIGVSPETYDPRPSDLVAVSGAQLIVMNGAGLETWLDKLLGDANSGATVLVLSNGMPVAGRDPHQPAGESGNPHLWLDPVYAQAYVQKIAAALSQIDPANAPAYAANARAEVRRLRLLDASIREQIATVPRERRSAIVFHDAWYYFDRRYGIRDVGAIEPTPGREPSAQWFARLVALARAQRVRAIFGEPQFSPSLVRQLADETGVKTVTQLYDDTLGTTPQLETYEGIMRYDVAQMLAAMKS